MKINTYWLACAVLLYTVTFCQVSETQGKALFKDDTPPCREIVKSNKEKFGDSLPADLVNPNCDEDGYFTPLQCILSPLRCHCVDKYGNTKTELSRVMLFGIPDCKNFSQRSTMAPTTQEQPTTADFQLELPICWAEVVKVAGYPREKSIRYGSQSCDKDGYFTPLQCSPSLGCFCVDKYGNVTIQPSRNKSSIPDCRSLTHDAKSLTTKQNIMLPTTQVQPTTKELHPCWKSVEEDKVRLAGLLQDIGGTSCDKDGYFAPLQCRPLIGCYCVDKYGVFIKHLSKDISINQDCSNLLQPTTPELPSCWETVKENKANFGGNPPTILETVSCDKDGYFTPLQCHPIIGCFCVDKYGVRTTELSKDKSFVPDCTKFIQGTKPLTTRQRTKLPTADAQLTTKGLPPCWQAVNQKARFGSNDPQELGNPSCNLDGYFTSVQCRPLIGCFCVDKHGNPTTEPSNFKSIPKCWKYTLM